MTVMNQSVFLAATYNVLTYNVTEQRYFGKISAKEGTGATLFTLWAHHHCPGFS